MPARVVFACFIAVLPASAQWSRDVNAGSGPELIRAAQPDLAAIVRSEPAARCALIDDFAKRHGVEWMEAWKRFRNPELKDLFLALLSHQDWHVVHRALFALESFGDPAVAAKAWPLLSHSEPRMRERAAIAVLKLWEKGPPPGDVDALIAKEGDFHVRRCLDALKLRLQGKLRPRRVSEEFRVTGPDGLIQTPFLDGMDKAGRVAPGYAAKPNARQGGGGAAKLGPAPRWTWPLLGFGKEEASGVSLQPFANLRQNGTVYHTGTDVGACLEGAGFYAAAEGIVKLVHTGSDMGTLIVLEHAVDAGHLACAVYMHGGDTVFVEAGDKVACGQLLATMGLGFSIENGGHFAHLHFGLYPGAFSMTHNYGYKPVKAGLADWYDPARFLPRQIQRTQPLLADLRPVVKAVDRAAKLAEKGDYAKACAEAVALRDAADAPADVKEDARYLASEIAGIPERALARARAAMAAGRPSEAMKGLKDAAPKLIGIPGADEVKSQLAAREADPLVVKAIKGEGKVDAAEKKAASSKDSSDVRPLFEGLLKELGDTCLKERIQDSLK